MSSNPTPSQDPTPSFQYEHTAGFPGLLAQLGVSLVVSTYQAGKLMLVRSSGDKLNLLLRSFEQPMGIGLDVASERMAVATRRMLWILRSEPDIGPQLEPKGRHDACFVPRTAHVTGGIQGHDVGFVGGKPWLVNTMFSCLSAFDDDRYTFVPVWRPPFISRLAAEDRCHLNGMAIDGGEARYVTCMGATDEAGGWRENKVSGGLVLDVASGESVAQGLSMPHSPRVHRDQLFVCNSGHGELARVDPNSGAVEPIARVPGYTRGMGLYGDYAFVGLSQIRESRVFGGMPIADHFSQEQRQCGVHVINITTGAIEASLNFKASCQEIFDVQVLPGMRWPALPGFQGDGLDRVVTAPPEVWK